MLRGCQKKIVFLKNTGSKLFDEAYFVISDNASEDKICDSDMITEANRIIDECIGSCDNLAGRGSFGRALGFLKHVALPFFVGAMASVAVIIMFILIN